MYVRQPIGLRRHTNIAPRPANTRRKNRCRCSRHSHAVSNSLSCHTKRASGVDRLRTYEKTSRRTVGRSIAKTRSRHRLSRAKRISATIDNRAKIARRRTRTRIWRKQPILLRPDDDCAIHRRWVDTTSARQTDIETIHCDDSRHDAAKRRKNRNRPKLHTHSRKSLSPDAFRHRKRLVGGIVLVRTCSSGTKRNIHTARAAPRFAARR